MILGNGLIARALQPRFGADETVTIFASGVSNSAETDPLAFARERVALESCLIAAPAQLVYFSSCALGNPAKADTAYLRHKREMEARVLALPGSLVLRLPQVVGQTANPHTLTNFLHDRITRGEPFNVWRGAMRNLLDVDDMSAIAQQLIEHPPQGVRTMVIASAQTLAMPELVSRFEAVLGTKACFSVLERDSPLPIPASPAFEVARKLGIDLQGEYAARTLHKYYAPTESIGCRQRAT